MALGDGIARNKGRKGYAFSKGYNTAIDEFAERMIIMMPGHKQDIDEIAEELKGGGE